MLRLEIRSRRQARRGLLLRAKQGSARESGARPLYEEDFVVTARSGHPFLDSPTLANYCKMRHLLIAPRGDPHGMVDDLLSRRGLSRRIVLSVPNFMLGIDVISKTNLISILPKRFVAMQAERFGVAWAEAPLPLGRLPIMAVAPKVAMMDAGIAWLAGALERTAQAVGTADRQRH